MWELRDEVTSQQDLKETREKNILIIMLVGDFTHTCDSINQKVVKEILK